MLVHGSHHPVHGLVQPAPAQSDAGIHSRPVLGREPVLHGLGHVPDGAQVHQPLALDPAVDIAQRHGAPQKDQAQIAQGQGLDQLWPVGGPGNAPLPPLPARAGGAGSVRVAGVQVA